MRIVIAGSSGFLGTRLRRRLEQHGHDIVQLVRRQPTGADERRWDPASGKLDPAALAGAAAVINLAGAGVEDRRWTSTYKDLLVSSRVGPTVTLAKAIAALPAAQRPKALLNGSAIGFYGATGDREVDESSPAGEGFFPDLCQEWEQSAALAEEAGVRVALLRTGLVLDQHGGLLRPIALATRLFAGGPLAGGKWWMAYLSIEDWLAATEFVLARDDLAGPVNLVGPNPARNSDFVKALARQLHRPALAPVPKLALRALLGEFANETVLSARVLPGVLNRAGFTFQHPDLDSALRAALNSTRVS